MKAIGVISALTFKEAIRSRILYLLFFFALFLLFSSWIIGQLTVGDETKIIKDVGLASIHFLGILITIFIGVGLLFREMEKRTIYLILSKPVGRYEFLIGKFLGLALTLLLVIVSLGLVFALILVLKHNWAPLLPAALLMIYLEWLIIAGIVILFSTFSTPLLSGILTLACFFAGHLTESLHLLQNRIHSTVADVVLSLLFYALPNLEMFNIRLQTVHNIPVPAGYFLESILYCILYLGAILLLSVSIFQKKDFQ